MSGHSKWSTIKHKKAKEDAKRGKVFTRLVREMMVAAREGGGDTAGNARLRLLVDKARAANMPQENIIRAIKRGTGEIEGVSYEPATYEGYGPGGIAVMVETLSDNKNRTVSTLRHLFSKMGGSFAETGAVSWMFEQKGVVTLSAEGKREEEVYEKLMDCGLDDIKFVENSIALICPSSDLGSVKQAAHNAGFTVTESELAWIAKNPVAIDDRGEEEKAYKFLEALEEMDDVQNVHTNLE